jgi:nitrous oxidase accessory protein
MSPALAPLLAIVALAGPQDMAAPTPPGLEGRPAPADRSPLQRIVDAAPAGAIVRVPPGTYRGDLHLDRPLTIVGEGRPVLEGSGKGSVIRVRAARVVIAGFLIDGRGLGRLADDASGIHVAARDVVIRDCEIRGALFGIYLREADGAIVERATITGDPGKPAGEQGSGIHVWHTRQFRLIENVVRHTRDGFYIQSSDQGYLGRNVAADLRYGLHFMSSDDNTFEDNRFANGAAGAALMYSKRLTFRRNAFVGNRGFASVGLLLKSCDDVVATRNLIGNNARGVFIEGTARAALDENVIAQSDVAVVLYDSSTRVTFRRNAFYANLAPLDLVGRRTDAVFDRNYWADADEPDLDGDLVRDGPYLLSSVFDHVRGNLTAADLMTRGLTARAVAAAEQAFPVLAGTPVADRHPLAAPPDVRGVPAARGDRPGAGWLGMGVSALASISSVALIIRGGRPGRRRARHA